jgi:hypothetical protein
MNESLLVGPGKKFADYEALEHGKIEADKFIEQLEAEQARLRDELEQRLSYEDFLTRMEEQKSMDSRQDVDNQARRPPKEPETAITPQDIERIVEQREQRRQLENNLKSAMAKYAEANGPNFASKLTQQATELGMSEDNLKAMAANNPKAFYKLTGVEETPRRVSNFEAPPRTSFIPETKQTNRDAEYFRKMRAEKPSEYWTPAVQNQIHKAVREGRLDIDDI